MFYKLNHQKYSVHEIILNSIKSNSKILELGCCTGYISKRLKDKGCKVWGADKSKVFLIKAKEYCEEVYRVDLDNISQLKVISKRDFDYILLMDVLEHLRNPKDLLRYIKINFKVKKNIIISIPNIANISVRIDLLFGKFEYTEVGLLDKTHIKFFTLDSAREMLISSGLKIDLIDYSSNLGLVNLLGRVLKHIPIKVQYLFTRISPRLLAGQFVFICSL